MKSNLKEIVNQKTEKRKIRLLQLLQERDAMEVDAIANLLKVSTSTLRRDLRDLVDQGSVRLVVGRVELAGVGAEEIPYALRELVNRDEKRRIARLALEQVQTGETIYISGGTTTVELARLLPGNRRVMVITNSLRVVYPLVDQPGIELVVVGGQVRSNEQTLHGHLTEWGAQQLRADTFFYGIPALHPQHGLTHWQTIEVNTDRFMSAAARRVIVLADHSKFGKVAPALVLPVDKVDLIITGRETEEKYLKDLRSQNVKVISA